MPAVWTYPWGLAAEGVTDAVADLADRGIDTVALASHYHSVESFQPRAPEEPFDRYPGGCYFDPDGERFGATPIDPPVNDVSELEDPVGDVVAVARDHGVSVTAWTVLFHNSRLGAENPDYRIRDAFGTPHEHAFCPSHGAVRRYFEAVVGTLADYGVGAVELESVGYPSVLHPHDTTFGHPKRHVLGTATDEWLLSQCFCGACRERATAAGVDVAAARSVVRSVLEASLDAPGSDPPSLAALVREHPPLEDLLRFRASVIGDLLEALADAAGDTPLDCYLMDGFGVDPGDGWPAGVRLDDVDRHCDRATVLCYVDDPAVARQRVRTAERALDVPVDAGVTLDPDVVPDEETFGAVAGAARDAATGDLCVYHHTLASDAQLAWIERAVGDSGR